MDHHDSDWRLAYENYSLWGVTDPHAPVQANGEIVVAAEPRRVWATLTDVCSWPQLRSDIDRVIIDGPVAQGATCVLESAGTSLTIVFGLLVAPREINWTTATTGLVMTNRYVLIPQGESTRVISNETITAPSHPQFDRDALTARIATWLAALKHAAEDGSNQR